MNQSKVGGLSASIKNSLILKVKEVGGGVIHRIDTNLDEIVTKDGSSYSVTGLKDQIYRFRKNEV